MSQQVFFGNSMEQYCWFVGIILFGLLLLRFFSRMSGQLIFKIIKKFSSDVNSEKFIALLLKPLELLIFLVLLFWAISQLAFPFNAVFFHRKGEEITYIDVLDKIFLFLFIVSIAWICVRVIDFIALVFSHKAKLTESKSDDQLVTFVRELFKVLTGIFAFFVLLALVFEINVLTLITGLGIGGIAVALAAKDGLENLFASFTIFFDKPFIKGDLVKVDGVEGNIEKVGFRSTQIRSINKSIITIPNRKMIDDALENLTLRNFRRIKFNIGLNYGTSASQLEKIVLEINELIKSVSNVGEENIAIFEEFGVYSLQIMVLYYIEMVDYLEYLKLRESVNFKIAEIVSRNGSSFATINKTLLQEDFFGRA